MQPPKVTFLKNKLPLITLHIPHLDSATSLIAVGTGSRNENLKINGISHFLEHMFFKGSKKYPSAEIISSIVDGMGAVNNAWTSNEVTCYWVKSSTETVPKAIDILSSMLKESLLKQEEIDREKGVIMEEMKMSKDDPKNYVWRLYHKLHFGDKHPLGLDVIGQEETVKSLTRKDFLKYMATWYNTNNMAIVFVGNLPKNIEQLAEEFFGDIIPKEAPKFIAGKQVEQKKSKVNLFYKQTDQAAVVLGVKAYDRYHPSRYATRVLAAILGEGMSSRLFLQVRERRGLAYYIRTDYDAFWDDGYLVAYSGLQIDKLEEGIRVIKDEFEKIAREGISQEELKKVQEMIRGRFALRSESTNFLAENYGVDYVLDEVTETIEEYVEKILKVTAEEVQQVAKDLFKPNSYNLQIIAPLKDAKPFEKIFAD